MNKKLLLFTILLAFLSINCQKSSNEIKLGQISNKLIVLDSNLVTLFDLPESCYNISLSEINKPKEFTNIYCYSQYYESLFFYYYCTDIIKNNVKYKLIFGDKRSEIITSSYYVYLSRIIDGKEKGIYIEWGEGNSGYVFTNIPKDVYMKLFPKFKGILLNEYPKTVELEFNNTSNICSIDFE